jgi:hypothetical protein
VLVAAPASALDCVEAPVLRRGAGRSTVPLWPSASAVRATWSSSTLANRAGGPVPDPGGPLAAAPGSVEVAGVVDGSRAAGVLSAGAAPGALATDELVDAAGVAAALLADVEGIGADGPVMLPSAGS